MNPVVKAILDRRSIRKYKPKQITKEELDTLIECAKYAPSGKNKQTWHFTVVQNKEIIDEMNIDFKQVATDNKKIAEEGYHVFYHAPTVIVVSGKEDETYAQADCASAVENILIAAEALGLGSCFVCLVIKIFQKEDLMEKYQGKLQLPEGYKPLYTVAVGYPEEEGTKHPRKENVVTYIQ